MIIVPGVDYKLNGLAEKIARLFHIYEPDKIEFGHQIKLPLLTAEGRIEEHRPTLDNLAIHLGLYQEIQEQARQMKEKGVSRPAWQEKAMTGYKKYNVMLHQHIRLLRHLLEAPRAETKLWFYCLPREEFLLEDSTGQLRYSSGNNRFVLALLPPTAKKAQEYYHCPEEELLALGPQIAWLTVKFCTRHRLLSQTQAQRMLADWEKFMSDAIILAANEQINLLPMRTPALSPYPQPPSS